MILDRMSRHTGQTLSRLDQISPTTLLGLSASFNNAIEAIDMFSRVKAYLHVDYKPGERRLVQKIDFFILTFCCLSYLVNYVRCPSLTALMRLCLNSSIA